MSGDSRYFHHMWHIEPSFTLSMAVQPVEFVAEVQFGDPDTIVVTKTGTFAGEAWLGEPGTNGALGVAAGVDHDATRGRGQLLPHWEWRELGLPVEHEQ